MTVRGRVWRAEDLAGAEGPRNGSAGLITVTKGAVIRIRITISWHQLCKSFAGPGWKRVLRSHRDPLRSRMSLKFSR
jgi:hypothetical protein